jgi:hypothetical protein
LRIIILTLGIIVFLLGAARAGNPFDGKWHGLLVVPDGCKAPPPAGLTGVWKLNVKNGFVTGQIALGRIEAPLAGPIDSDGKIEITSGVGVAKTTFSNGEFHGIYRLNSGCNVPATLLPAVAGPYDGQWEGLSIPPGSTGYGRGNCYASVKVIVENNILSGNIEYGRNPSPIVAKIEADGTMTGRAGPFDLEGKFSGDKFEGWYTNQGCGRYRLTLDRR